MKNHGSNNMKHRMKKIIATLVLTITFTQIGCTHIPVQKVSSLDEIEFKPGNHYAVDQKTRKTTTVPGNQIKSENGKLIIQNGSKQKIINDADVYSVTAINDKRSGSYWDRGALIGGLAFFAPLFIISMVDLAKYGTGNTSPDYECRESLCTNFAFPLIGGVLLGGLGALVGAGVGSIIPKHEQIKIIPIVSPSKTSGTTTGGSLQFRF